jgi:hypothetical protein
MTPAQKLRRSIRQDTVIKLTRHLAKSYLGFKLTTGQLKAAAKQLYYIKLSDARKA